MRSTLFVLSMILGGAIALGLTGCGTNGTPLILASMYNGNDPCQARNHGGDWSKLPSWCGASNNRTYIYDNNGRIVGYVKR